MSNQMAIVSDLIGLYGAERANSANRAMAREQMTFQKRMSDTSYQRAVADLNAAGLNPMLAYGQGGASTPPGSSAQMQNSTAAGAENATRYMERELMKEKINTEKAVQESTRAQAYKTTQEGHGVQWDNKVNFGGGDPGTEFQVDELIGPKSRSALKATLENLRLQPGLTTETTALNKARVFESWKYVDKLRQDIETGKATEANVRETTKHVKELINVSKLDQSQKKAYADAWDKLGSSGAMAKEAVPFLRMLMMMIGK